MRLALAALVLALPAVSSAGTPPPPGAAEAVTRPQICRQDLKLRPARMGDTRPAKRLGELPPGDLTLAVVNRVGRCIEPVIARQGYGALVDGTGR